MAFYQEVTLIDCFFVPRQALRRGSRASPGASTVTTSPSGIALRTEGGGNAETRSLGAVLRAMRHVYQLKMAMSLYVIFHYH